MRLRRHVETIAKQGTSHVSASRPAANVSVGSIPSVRPPMTASGLPSTADIAHRDHHFRKVPMIGIGGSLAAPPLPHHRTYGSVYGGSRSYANALRSNDSTRVGWAFGFMHHRERFDVFPQRLPGFTRRCR